MTQLALRRVFFRHILFSIAGLVRDSLVQSTLYIIPNLSLYVFEYVITYPRIIYKMFNIVKTKKRQFRAKKRVKQTKNCVINTGINPLEILQKIGRTINV